MAAKHSADSRIIKETRETMRGLHACGAISDASLQAFEASPVTPVKKTSLQITLKPAVAAAFPTSKAVNDALEGLLRLANPPRRRVTG